ncbi:hypothetical protein TNCV_306011 [Trichonephila clavipes]|nr:hypothetical protein TNCV_306011 [Trichonephila clavipes]
MFKKCGIETHNHTVFNEHNFAASKATGHDVVRDETENNSANPQTLPIKSRPNSPVVSTSKNGVIRMDMDILLVKRNIVTLQQNNGSSAVVTELYRAFHSPLGKIFGARMAFLSNQLTKRML